MYLNLIENIMNFVINTKNKVLDQTYKSRTSISLVRILDVMLFELVK